MDNVKDKSELPARVKVQTCTIKKGTMNGIMRADLNIFCFIEKKNTLTRYVKEALKLI